MNDLTADKLYYVKKKNGDVCMRQAHLFSTLKTEKAMSFVDFDDDDILAVIAPVLDYHSLCELKQELEICKDEKADLYAKLCNALMQLEEANEIIANFRTYDFTRDDEIAEEYQVKYGIEGKKIYTNRKPLNESEPIEKVEELKQQLEYAERTLKNIRILMACDPSDMKEIDENFCADQLALETVNGYFEKYGAEK